MRRALLLSVLLALCVAPRPRTPWLDEPTARRVAAEQGRIVLTWVVLGPAGQDDC